ncbi:MAG: DUF5694 domain-containing protein [Gemmatimonadales bacterium]
MRVVGLLVAAWGAGAVAPSAAQSRFDAPCLRTAPTPNPLVAKLNAAAPPDQTEVLVLGTPHLRVLSSQPAPSSIDPVLEVLERFQPGIVAVESMPAWLIADMEQNAPRFDGALRYFAADRIRYGRAAQTAIGRSRLEAERDAAVRLAALTETGAAAGRSEVVLALLAAYDLDSALLQWSYLSTEQRRAAVGVPAEIREFLDRELTKPNEKITIALALARRLGLSRIAAIDDNREAPYLEEVGRELGAHMQDNPHLKAAAGSALYSESDRELKSLVAEQRSLLPFYLFMNSAGYADTDLATQWGVFLRTRLASGADRMRLALWDVRNLRIASHIREAGALKPGSRMVVVIGAAHKPFLDHYLEQMSDAGVAQLQALVCPEQR